jgi:hypothetical protein
MSAGEDLSAVGTHDHVAVVRVCETRVGGMTTGSCIEDG